MTTPEPERILYTTNSLLPSNPEIVDCPVSKRPWRDGRVPVTEVSLTHFPESYRHPYDMTDAVVAAVGPIACNGCAEKCPDAYLPLDEEKLEILETYFGAVSLATTPVSIRLLEEGAPKEDLSISEFGNVDGASTSDRVYGWNNRLSDEIVNGLIDAYAADLAVIDRRGVVTFHDGPFYSQDELPFPTQPQTAAELNPTVTPGLGQQQLF